MVKIKEFFQRHLKITLVVAALGIGVTFAYTADGCSVDVSQEMMAK